VSDPPITTLPFVKDSTGPAGRTRVFWAPDCAGLDYVAGCDLGTELALEAVQYMRAENLPSLLAWAVIDMPPYAAADDAGKGAMVGFLVTLGRLAMDAATRERLALYEVRHALWQETWRRLVAEDEAKRRRTAERRRARRREARP
jgi:hypothetical protein